MKRRQAFTLIELLIVVGIIAILAAVAVPNFLEAQTRSKVARAKSDLRALAVGLEAYAADHNQYPLCNNEMMACRRPGSDAGQGAERWILERLSTPIAYMSSAVLTDPFQPSMRAKDHSEASPQGTTEDLLHDSDMPVPLYYKYGSWNPPSQGAASGFADVVGLDGPAKGWFVSSAGPDRKYNAMRAVMAGASAALVSAQLYDPSNGTVSYGEIYRVGGQPLGGSWGGEFFRQASSGR